MILNITESLLYTTYDIFGSTQVLKFDASDCECLLNFKCHVSLIFSTHVSCRTLFFATIRKCALGTFPLVSPVINN